MKGAVEKECAFCGEITKFVQDENGKLYCSKCGFYDTESEDKEELTDK